VASSSCAVGWADNPLLSAAPDGPLLALSIRFGFALVWVETVYENNRLSTGETLMIVLGLVLLLIGFILAVPILWTIGLILLVVGVVFELLGATGRAVGGRRHYF
jgi:Family of unknown function (DUF6131)